MIVKEQGFRTSLAFIVAGPTADGIHVPPVGFSLGVDLRVTVDFRGRSLHDLCLQPLCQSKHIYGAVDIHFGRLNRVILIMNGWGRAGQIIDFINFYVQGISDIVTVKFEIRVVQQVDDVALASRVEIVNAQHIIALFEEPFAEVGTEESSSTRHRATFTKMHENSFRPGL